VLVATLLVSQSDCLKETGVKWPMSSRTAGYWIGIDSRQESGSPAGNAAEITKMPSDETQEETTSR
jgi:hypothetical protein